MNNFSKKWIKMVIMIGIVLSFCHTATAVGGDVGWYDIHCNVDDAKVYFDGAYKGQVHSGVLSVGVYTTGTPYSTVSVQKDGYYTATASLPSAPSAGQTKNVYVTLNPEPSPTESEYGSIHISTSPSGARIHLDDQYRGLSPITLSGLRPGSYSIDAEMDSYETAKTTVTVSAGKTQNIYLKLVSPGSVSVESKPTDAYVYVNGNNVGKTPYVVTGLSSGNHEFMVTMNGYYNWKKTVNVIEGQQKMLYATLQPIDQVQSVLVTSTPPGASIYLDGSYQGETMEGQAFPIRDVSPGIHSLVLELEGYPDYRTSVTVVQGGEAVETDALMGQNPTQTTGSIYVTSSPSGAMIYLDDEYRGVATPHTLTGVSPGEHTITLRLDGYSDGISKVTVNAGETAQLTIGLASGSSGGTTTPTTTSLPGFTAIAAAFALIAAVLFIGMRKK